MDADPESSITLQLVLIVILTLIKTLLFYVVKFYENNSIKFILKCK